MTDTNELIRLLDLEEIEQNHYRATSPNEGWQRVYGGQVLGQALVAASRTVPEDRQAHSLHGYFLRAGDTTVPILYKVDRIRDGLSFTTRRVVAIQHGRPIFNMSISFQVPEESGGIHLLTPRFVAAAHRRGLAVQPWTINETEDLKRILALGVDGINTDNPDRLLDLLK